MRHYKCYFPHLFPSYQVLVRIINLSSTFMMAFFQTLVNPLLCDPHFMDSFVWESSYPLKVKSLVWIQGQRKLNTNIELQPRRYHKAISPNICFLYLRNSKPRNPLFLHHIMSNNNKGCLILLCWTEMFCLALWISYVYPFKCFGTLRRQRNYRVE